jgi:hypothetical protein
MDESSIIRQERTISRAGRWIMAFGAVCLLRLFLLLPEVLSPDMIATALFLQHLVFGIVAILTGEAVTRKKGWAFVTSMVMGGLLAGVSMVAMSWLIRFGLKEWRGGSPGYAFENFGPWLIVSVVVLIFWLLILRTILNVAAVLRDKGSPLPSRRVLMTWLGSAFTLGIGSAVAVVLPSWLTLRY